MSVLASTPPWLLPALAGGLLALAGLWAGLRLARRRQRQQAARARRLGGRGERRALRLLDERGYRILGTQVVGEGHIEVDGRIVTFVVRADALVRRRRRRYVAELKGGPAAARPTDRATRRQLLEYALVFPVHGVLLVDARRGLVRRVRFPRPRR